MRRIEEHEVLLFLLILTSLCVVPCGCRARHIMYRHHKIEQPTRTVPNDSVRNSYY